MELHIRNLTKSYGKQTVLKDAGMSFEKGRIYSILGRNGAGKTTLFNCINGDLKYEGGNITCSDGTGERPLSFSDVGLVSDSPVLPDYLTGYEFIHYFIKLHGVEDRSTEDWLDLVWIDPSDYFKLIKAYSHGMKNKLQLLCCLIRNPGIILLDEPLSSFDVLVSHEIKELLVGMKNDHIILMSTHILQLAQDVSDDIVLLHQGKLTAMRPEDLRDGKFESSIIEALKKED